MSDEDANFLEKHEAFCRHRDRGFMVLRRDKARPEKVAADMTPRDESRPRTPDDYKNQPDEVKEGVLAAKPVKTKGKKSEAKAETDLEDLDE